MPNKYSYTRMKTEETFQRMTQAGLTVSDLVKLFGRHYHDIQDYLDPRVDKNPTTPEMFILIYLSENRDKAVEFLDIANVRITDGRQNKGRLYGEGGIL